MWKLCKCNLKRRSCTNRIFSFEICASVFCSVEILQIAFTTEELCKQHSQLWNYAGIVQTRRLCERAFSAPQMLKEIALQLCNCINSIYSMRITKVAPVKLLSLSRICFVPFFTCVHIQPKSSEFTSGQIIEHVASPVTPFCTSSWATSAL